MKKSERGYVTVEASIVLTIFMFAFLAMISVMSLIRAQITIQVGINQAAKELSQYSYIVARTGLIQKNNQINEESQKFKEQSDQVIGNLVNFVSTVQSGAENVQKTADSAGQFASSGKIEAAADAVSGISDTATSFNEIQAQAKGLYSSVSAMAENPAQIMAGLVAVVKSEGISMAKSRLIAAPLSKALVARYIKGTGKDPDSYLKSLGIYEGLDGLHFEASTLFDDGSTINITVIYNARIKFPLMDKFDFTFKCNASTAVWGAKLTFAAKNKSSVWDNANFPRDDIISGDLEKEADTKKYVVADSNAGFNLYDEETNTFTAFHSLDTNAASYTDENGNMSQSAIQNKVDAMVSKLINNKRKSFTMKESGEKVTIDKSKQRNLVIRVTVPTSAKKNEAMLQEIARNAESAYHFDGDIKVEFIYRE